MSPPPPTLTSKYRIRQSRPEKRVNKTDKTVNKKNTTDKTVNKAQENLGEGRGSCVGRIVTAAADWVSLNPQPSTLDPQLSTLKPRP